MRLTTLQDTDPVLMTLGERTTRLPAEPVNPRAAFEAFERGDHTAAAVREVRITYTTAINKTVEYVKLFVAATVVRTTLEDVAHKHYGRFGSEATMRLIRTVGDSTKLKDVPDDRVLPLLRRLRDELMSRPVV